MASDRMSPRADKVSLTVDGRNILLNPFVQSLVANLVHGLVASLKMEKKEYSLVEIRVEVEERTRV